MDAKIITEKQSCLSSYLPASWEAAVANSPCGNRTQALGILAVGLKKEKLIKVL